MILGCDSNVPSYSHFKTIQYYLYFAKRKIKTNHKNACTSAQLPKSKSLVKPSIWTLARIFLCNPQKATVDTTTLPFKSQIVFS